MTPEGSRAGKQADAVLTIEPIEFTAFFFFLIDPGIWRHVFPLDTSSCIVYI